MRTTLTSGESEVIIERGETGIGICYGGPIPPENPNADIQVAYDLLSELIEYLGKEEPKDYIKSTPSVVVPMIPLPVNTPTWIVTETPYTWKGQVIVSKDSLKYYQMLWENLIELAESEKSEMIRINLYSRASFCKEIINGLSENLGKLSEH